MIEASPNHKRYAPARLRFLHPLLSRYLCQELQYFGPDLSDRLAERIVNMFEALCPAPESLRPGQLLWNALHRQTRGDARNRRFVPVVLSIITEGDIERLVNGDGRTQVRRDAIARVFVEAIEQGGVLSSRDVALMFHQGDDAVSRIRTSYETEHGQPLPHTGVLHDMGSSITHKAIIVRKAIQEKKDPATVAKETRHSQRAVDRYLRDYHRVQTLYELKADSSFISQATGMSKSLVKEYIKLLKEESDETNQ